jgi:hypothetical protein
MPKTRVNVRVDAELWEAVKQAEADGVFKDKTAAVEQGLRLALGRRAPKPPSRNGPSPEAVRAAKRGLSPAQMRQQGRPIPKSSGGKK